MFSVDTKELRKAMIDAGINTTSELSEKSGVNRNTLGDILNEKIFPSSDVMSRIAEALKLSGEDAGRIFFSRKLA